MDFSKIDEAFDRGYKQGFAHGSRHSGMTWNFGNGQKPADEACVMIAHRTPVRRWMRKILSLDLDDSFVLSVGEFIDGTEAWRTGQTETPIPDAVMIGRRKWIYWTDVLAWAYVNPEEVENYIMKGEKHG